MKFNPRNQTIRDYVSDDILHAFLKQLPWRKNQFFTTLTGGVYRDIVMLDQITDATIKIKKGTMSGRFFVEILKQLPHFKFEDHYYRVWYSTLFREAIPAKKHINKWPGFNVRKLLRSPA